MKTYPYCQRRNCSPQNVLFTFQRCTDCVDIARRSSARGRQTTVRRQKQVFIHTSRLSRAYLALARLSCYILRGFDLLIGPCTACRVCICIVEPLVRFRTSTSVTEYRQESPADAGIPARRKNDEKNPPFRSYNKFHSSRKSGVYSN